MANSNRFQIINTETKEVVQVLDDIDAAFEEAALLNYDSDDVIFSVVPTVSSNTNASNFF